ncbi:MAG TPA: 50S ribosomal protein L18 [Thermoanaerobaculia bacterium]|jgi:large subunit ribosomal protein L18|nr:50S ribosomal protein L18 [Thermoanaerobaculia bacterium]
MTDLAKRSQRKTWRRQRAHLRVRSTVSGTAARPRLSVFKSLRYVYAQLIDDAKGITLATASSLEPQLKQQLGKGTGNAEAAKLVGATLAERAKQAGIEKVVFDRSGYVYHGRVKVLAEAARERGLDF